MFYIRNSIARSTPDAAKPWFAKFWWEGFEYRQNLPIFELF